MAYPNHNDSGPTWEDGHVQTGADWQDLSPSSRAWLHCANRILSITECEEISEVMEGFVRAWTAHGQSLKASWKLEGRRCLVIALDESKAGATGCSIDALSRRLQEHGKQNGLDWMQRNTVLYNVLTGFGWQEVNLHEFWAMRKSNLISDLTPLVNAVIRLKSDAEPSVVQPFAQTWHAEMW